MLNINPYDSMNNWKQCCTTQLADAQRYYGKWEVDKKIDDIIISGGSVTPDMVQELEQGVDIGEEKLTLPARVKILNVKEIELTITEGKFHQVKRMLKAVGNEVTYLKRLSMGSLILDEELKLGEYRSLTDTELLELRKR